MPAEIGVKFYEMLENATISWGGGAYWESSISSDNSAAPNVLP
jgi:hypothetical protein